MKANLWALVMLEEIHRHIPKPAYKPDMETQENRCGRAEPDGLQYAGSLIFGVKYQDGLLKEKNCEHRTTLSHGGCRRVSRL